MTQFNVGSFSQEKFYVAQQQKFKHVAREQKDELQEYQKEQQREQQKARQQEQSLSTGLQWATKGQAAAPQTATMSSAVSGTATAKEMQSVQQKNTARVVMDDLGDTATLSTSVIATSVAGAEMKKKVWINDPLRTFREQAQERFTKLFETAYAGSFSHNRLLGKLSELKAGVAMKMLSLLGVSSIGIDTMRGEIRHQLIEQNKTNMAQVIYDKTLLEIIG